MPASFWTAVFDLHEFGNGVRVEMLIRIGYEIVFEAPQPIAMTALLHVHPSREWTLRTPEVLEIEPHIFVENYTDAFGNRATRFQVPEGRFTLRTDCVVADSGEPDPVQPDAPQHSVLEMPPDVLR